MKVVCLIFMLVQSEQGIALVEAEKPLESVSECAAYIHQQEFQPPVAPVLVTQMSCLAFWEA